jgi:uncharacterized protein (DUF4415 family)/uncharacterized DUF497 family protein
LYIHEVPVTFDPAKRAVTLVERGLDFADATRLFTGALLEIPDERFDYGEKRFVTFGFLNDRMVVVVWTPRGGIVTSSRCERPMDVNKQNIESEWVDPDDAPELDDDWFDRAEFRIGDQVIRKGRPLGSAKRPVSLRLDEEVIAYFRSAGPGWQTRMNDALRKASGL